MSQIISIHIGGCGAKVGLKYWNEMYRNIKSKRQKQDRGQVLYSHKFCRQNSKGQAIFIDTDIRTKIQAIQSNLNIDPNLCIGQANSCRNLFAQGHYGIGKHLTQQFNQKLRRQTQKCDLISGFMLLQSPCGGVGSGVSANVISNLRQNYSRAIIQSFNIVQGETSHCKMIASNPLSIYNIVLNTYYSTFNTDISYHFQNTVVQKIYQRRGNTIIKYDQINQYYGHCLNQHIHAYLYSGRLNTNQRKRATNLIPFPRIKYMCGSLSDPKQKLYVQSALENKNKLMAHQQQSGGKNIFALAAHINNQYESQNEINKIITSWSNKSGNFFVQWLPNNISLSLGNAKQSKKQSAWLLFNDYRNLNWAKKVIEGFTSFYRRKAFVYHYTSLGMEEIEFVEAESNLNDEISYYTSYQSHYDEENDYAEEQYGYGQQ